MSLWFDSKQIQRLDVVVVRRQGLVLVGWFEVVGARAEQASLSVGANGRSPWGWVYGQCEAEAAGLRTSVSATLALQDVVGLSAR